jgi:hypothetical protein
MLSLMFSRLECTGLGGYALDMHSGRIECWVGFAEVSMLGRNMEHGGWVW